jgi:hypothetical protein
LNISNNASNSIWEIARPSYIAVPPNIFISGRFESDKVDYLEIFILVDNANVNDANECFYDTKGSMKVSKCAKVELFEKIICFRIKAHGRNVMLKYKGSGILEARKGSSVKRVGVFNKLIGAKSPNDESALDFSTNIDSNAIELFACSWLFIK